MSGQDETAAVPAETTTAPLDETAEASDETTSEQTEAPAFDAEHARTMLKRFKAEKLAAADRARKAEERATTAEESAKRVPDLEAELVRERVARRLSLPDELVDRLRGATEDEVMADAEKLVALVAPKPKAPATNRPVESLQPGSGSQQEPSLDDRIAAARASGDYRAVIALENSKLQKT